MRHTSVMVREVVDGLDLKPGMVVIDATLGDGGHAEAIMNKIGNGTLIGIDQDPQSIARARAVLDRYPNFIPVQGNFRQLGALSPKQHVDAILFDLGWSTPQFKERNRGFSFQTDEPLDMRMDPSATLTAYDIVNAFSEEEIGRIIRAYGEDKRWKQIAKNIVAARESAPIESTRQLVEIIGGRRTGAIHPATRTFQALRIAVNDELHALKEGLEQAIALLKTGGRIAVISFHSLEDRIVKHALGGHPEMRVITKRPITPSIEEINNNPRARSAKLRIAEKITPSN